MAAGLTLLVFTLARPALLLFWSRRARGIANRLPRVARPYRRRWELVIPPVLKTVVLSGFAGSNPAASDLCTSGL